jgi:hypothetical protein
VANFGIAAGSIGERIKDMHFQDYSIKLRQRTYKPEDENTRQINLKQNLSKIVSINPQFTFFPKRIKALNVFTTKTCGMNKGAFHQNFLATTCHAMTSENSLKTCK